MRAILAGIMIAIGGCVFIGCTDRGVGWVGAILFSVGLMTVFQFGLDLYTGKVGYALENKPSFVIDLLIMILGNLVGCIIIGYMMPSATAETFINARLENVDYLRVLFKGILCGILMFIAADIYKKRNSFVGAFICVPVFILSGFEHSIADMFYFMSAGFHGLDIAFSMDAVLFILVVIVGNAIGGLLFPAFTKEMYEKKKEE